jgi:hypothetical protein
MPIWQAILEYFRAHFFIRQITKYHGENIWNTPFNLVQFAVHALDLFRDGRNIEIQTEPGQAIHHFGHGTPNNNGPHAFRGKPPP